MDDNKKTETKSSEEPKKISEKDAFQLGLIDGLSKYAHKLGGSV